MAFHDQVVLVVIDGIGEGCCRLSLIGGRLFAERGAVDDVELAPEFRELADDAFALLRPVRAVDQQIGAGQWRLVDDGRVDVEAASVIADERFG